MNETINVSGFAGLNKIELSLNEFNLLIGPQATGKSIIAKLLFYFKGVVWQLFQAAENHQGKRDFDQVLIYRFKELFPQQSWGPSAFKISYTYSNLTIDVSYAGGSKAGLQIEYSQSLRAELIRLRRRLKSTEQNPKEEDLEPYEIIFKMRESMVANLQETIGPRAASTQLFIPAGRSFFANLQSSIFSFLSGNNAIDPFLKEFGSFYENMKRSGPSRRRPEENMDFAEESQALIQEILCGKYVNEKGKDYLDVIDGRRINLANCSSGQQETLPLALILKRLPFLRGRNGGYAVYIEEPEAHLFPTAQRLILELIALTFNASNSRVQVLITTHSPYVLTSLNNLLQAGILFSTLESSDQAKVAKLVPKTRAIPFSSVAAYSLTREGCHSILDQETKLLGTDLIDRVSTDLSIQFDRLLTLE